MRRRGRLRAATRPAPQRRSIPFKSIKAKTCFRTVFFFALWPSVPLIFRFALTRRLCYDGKKDGGDVRTMDKTIQRPRPPIFRRAALAALLFAAVMLSSCGQNEEAAQRLGQTLTQSSVVCCETALRALGEAHEKSQLARARRVFESAGLAAKTADPEAAAHRKAYDPRRTPYGPEGTAGRLVIPSVGINVALYLSGEDAQALADAEDSACWMEIRSDLNGVIGDHVNQDFSALFYIRPGDSCSIFKNGREHRYVCVSTGYGSNVETDVLDEDGSSLFDCGDDRLCMYTCANGWQYIFYTQWRCDGTRPLHQYEIPMQAPVFITESDEG